MKDRLVKDDVDFEIDMARMAWYMARSLDCSVVLFLFFLHPAYARIGVSIVV
jgi:hypothetical protein